MKQWFAENTNPGNFTGTVKEALVGADLFLGLSGPGVIEPADLAKMNKDAIVFAMANPTPEVMPEDAAPYVRIMATGRSDYPNQINNVLCFPGIFRGALDCGATDINEAMKLAAAAAIAGTISPEELDRGLHYSRRLRQAGRRCGCRGGGEGCHRNRRGTQDSRPGRTSLRASGHKLKPKRTKSRTRKGKPAHAGFPFATPTGLSAPAQARPSPAPSPSVPRPAGQKLPSRRRTERPSPPRGACPGCQGARQSAPRSALAASAE